MREEEIFTWIFFLVGTIVLFLVFREVNLWYWKVNEAIKLLREQNAILKKMAGIEDDSVSDESNRAVVVDELGKIKKLFKDNVISESDYEYRKKKLSEKSTKP